MELTALQQQLRALRGTNFYTVNTAFGEDKQF